MNDEVRFIRKFVADFVGVSAKLLLLMVALVHSDDAVPLLPALIIYLCIRLEIPESAARMEPPKQ